MNQTVKLPPKIFIPSLIGISIILASTLIDMNIYLKIFISFIGFAVAGYSMKITGYKSPNFLIAMAAFQFFLIGLLVLTGPKNDPFGPAKAMHTSFILVTVLAVILTVKRYVQKDFEKS